MGDRVENQKSGAELLTRKRLTVAAWAAGALVALSAVFVAAYWGGQHDAINKIRTRIIEPALARLTPAHDTNSRTIAWQDMRTHFHRLQRADIQLSPGAVPAVWALAEVGDNILMATRLGQFSYLDNANRFHALDLQVDLGLEAFRQSPLHDDPIFQITELRTYDLLVAPTGDNTYDLFVSHHRYTGQCFQMVVSRTRLRADASGIHAVDGRWEDLYIVRPCIQTKDIGMRFAGHEGGGRLVQVNPTTLLLSVGTYQFDGVTGPYIAGQDPETDLGKIIEISIPHHTGHIFTLGMRNPQGLLVARDGRIWETEHGPMGGDEVNLLRRGANYGWPKVTYGLEYGARPWPYNEHQGLHRGYTTPAFAFMPSIGISQIVEPNTEQFPLWEERLLVSSLYGNSLFVLKTEGDHIVYAEQLPMGERLRDMITLHDGRIAILTDSAKLILLRNAELNADGPQTFTVSGLSALPHALPEEAAPTSPEIYNTRMFHYYCGSCHTATGDTLSGPPLNGVVGRDIGGVAGFPYSDALANADGSWNRRRLRAFLSHSDPALAGTAMPAIDVPEDQFDAVYSYLETTRSTPQGDDRR